VFLPCLVRLRDLERFAEEVLVLLMDNWLSHVTDDVVRLLTEAGVRVMTFASHTTQVFQVLVVFRTSE
jgi:hypothetical protein